MRDYLAENGMDVYVPELRGHGLSRLAGSESPSGFSEYVMKDMPAIFGMVRKLTGGKRAFLAGHSLGGTIAFSLNPYDLDYLAGIILLAGPFHFGKGLAFLRAAGWLATHLHKYGALRVLDLLDSRLEFPIDKLGKLLLATMFFYNSRLNIIPYKLWYPGSIDKEVLEERVLLGYDKTGFQVVKDMARWAGTGRLIDSVYGYDFEENLKKNHLPALFLVGDKDEVVTPESMQPGFDLMPSPDKTWRMLNKSDDRVHWGHIDLTVGREAPNVVWPIVRDWIRERA